MSKVVPIKANQPLAAEPQSEEKMLAAIYRPTSQREMKALQKQHARRQKTNLAPRLKVTTTNGKHSIAVDHDSGSVGFTMLMEAMGTANADFAQGLLNQICNVSSTTTNEDAANFALSMVTGLEPRDQVEAMLASQMAAIQLATMTYARRLALADNLIQLESHERALNKLARTFVGQVEALKRYRSKGEQRVIVERVTVEKGGQAIVGNVANGGGTE
ncbi:hypothetical protein FJ976_01610 [Mesorhizobium sp. B1-1-9]|uniref:hypothetical protein n=1 Tax=Mesorhizobium sp. B1-1-9 TaxID=2589975 RepID=UPI00112B101F|nr:hypothetical protein [Mesorhizobium sp. B1-1-9]TPN58632.1 hypothetical protein FJ976_01610 [Mesorhizobium sp. B1-1-9]